MLSASPRPSGVAIAVVSGVFSVICGRISAGIHDGVEPGAARAFITHSGVATLPRCSMPIQHSVHLACGRRGRLTTRCCPGSWRPGGQRRRHRPGAGVAPVVVAMMQATIGAAACSSPAGRHPGNRGSVGESAVVATISATVLGHVLAAHAVVLASRTTTTSRVLRLAVTDAVAVAVAVAAGAVMATMVIVVIVDTHMPRILFCNVPYAVERWD